MLEPPGTQTVEFSWKRCLELGIRPTDHVAKPLLSKQELQKTLRENRALTETAIPIANRLYRFLKETGHFLSLVDRQGTIIHTVGDPTFEKTARRINMEVGANWQENRMGTNAIGVTLIERKPTRIHGDEHFYLNTRFLTCAASPIFSPKSELVGVINISGKKEQYHPYIFLLSQLIAGDIQKQLLINESEREDLLMREELDFLLNQYVSRPYLVIGNEGRIVRANKAAKRMIGEDCLGKNFEPRDTFKVHTIGQQSTRTIAIYDKNQREKRLHHFNQIEGTCPSLIRVKDMAKKVAKTDISVLILGESGTGKELFAQSIHTESDRWEKPFIALNCSAIPESLIESELFGYEPGSFTGASKTGQKGKVELAHKGTLFLDEIGDMSLRAQASLLRVLQEKEVTRIGGGNTKAVDIRVVAATNKNLLEEIKANRFRADLYYRLNGIPLVLPALRHRKDLIELSLILLYKMGYCSVTLSEEAKHKLLSYHWPGNVRELGSILNQAAFFSDGKEIRAEHIAIQDFTSASRPEVDDMSLKDIERHAITSRLEKTNWNISLTAENLQIGRNTLYRKIKEYGIVPHMYN